MDWAAKRKPDTAPRTTQVQHSAADFTTRPAIAYEPPLAGWRRLAEVAASAFLLGCIGLFLFRSRGWPLVNDAALMHYVVFLMQHGLAPYREIGDINLPGAYVPEWLSTMLAARLHIGEPAMWRCIDALALLLAGGAMLAIARPYSWFAGVFAASLFALYHGRDGIGQAGQRDLWMAMLLLWAVALLLAAGHRASLKAQAGCTFGAALLLGMSATIKPFAAAYLLLFLPLLFQPVSRARVQVLLALFIGFSMPLLAVALFLAHWQALSAFWHVLRFDLPYHARLADGSPPQLVLRSSVPSVWELLGLTVAATAAAGWAARRQLPGDTSTWKASPARNVLLLSALLGLASFLAQGKGYPYQRYPYLAFLLLVAALELASAVRSRSWLPRTLGTAGFAFGLLVCAPASLRAIDRAPWSTSVVQAMEHALLEQGGGGPESGGARTLDGEVQCIDSVSGCTDALLALHLRQATGTLYDEFLFPQVPVAWGTPYTWPPAGYLPQAVADGQGRFRAAMLQHPPRVLLVSTWLFMEGPGDYRKLELWPWFHAFLQQQYVLPSQQDFARAENGPMGFRVYVRRDSSFR